MLGTSRALEHLQSAKGVDVDSRRAGANRGDHVDVVVAIELGMDAALQTDFGGAPGLGFAHPFADLVQGEQVGVASQVE